MSPSKTPARPEGDVVSVRIELVDSDPLIWREVEIPTDITLTTLHHIVQAAMGWFDYHLWEFRVGGKTYALPMDEDWGTEPREEADKSSLADVLKGGRTIIGYTYDMGDDWAHKLVVSNRRPADDQVSYPRFVAGQNACPPDDCGGLPGSTGSSMREAIPSTPTMRKPRCGSAWNFDPVTGVIGMQN